MQDLLNQFARPVAGGGHDLEAQRLAFGVNAYPFDCLAPTGGGEKLGRLLRIEPILGDVGGMHPIQRIDAGLRHRLLAAKQLVGDRLAVEGIEQRLAHPAVLEDRIVEVEIDVLKSQPRLEDDLILLPVPSLEGQRLVDAEAKLAGDHVDAARQQVRFQSRRVLDHPDGNFVERRRLARPFRIALEDDVRTGDGVRHQIRPHVESGVLGVGIEGGADSIGGGVGEIRPFDVRRQQIEN